MRILVTGAHGFLGRALARHLASRNHEITALTRRSSPSLPPTARTLEAELLDAQATADALRGEYFDAVIHAAAITPAASGDAQQPVTHEGNVLLTGNLLAALSTPPAKLVHLSTLDVYAQPTGDTVLSEISALDPVSPYACSKLKAERLCDEWAQCHAVPCTTARLTQVFGPGDSSQKFIPSVIRKVRTGSPIELYGDGSDLRDFLFVDDAATLLASLTENKSASGVFNVASGASRSLNDVLSALAGITNHELVIEHLPRKKALVNYRFDVAKLNAATSNMPLSSFATALERTLAP